MTGCMAARTSFVAARRTAQKYRRSLRRTLLSPLLGVRSFREVVLNALADNGHLIYCRAPSGNFFVDPSDRGVGAELVWRGQWQEREFAAALDILVKRGLSREAAVFVDVGANIGTQTVYALGSGRFERGIAFEPEPRNADILRMNIEANGLSDRVVVRQTAVGEKAGRAQMALHPRNKGAHSIAIQPSLDSDLIDVPVERLDAALKALSLDLSRIGLIWIDAESSELAILRGLGDLFGRMPIVIEYSPLRMPAEAAATLCTLLRSKYANAYRLSPTGSEELPIAGLDRITVTTDILLLP
jgi:FkbM family methyltransferase